MNLENGEGTPLSRRRNRCESGKKKKKASTSVKKGSNR